MYGFTLEDASRNRGEIRHRVDIPVLATRESGETVSGSAVNLDHEIPRD